MGVVELEIEFELYNKSEGGRRYPIFEGYRASILFGLDDDLIRKRGQLSFKGEKFKLNFVGEFIKFKNEIGFNKKIYSNLLFNNPTEKVSLFLKPFNKFIISEPPTAIGVGIIKNVVIRK